jgi:transposase-like protein
MCPRCPLAQARVVRRGFFPRKTGRSRRIQRFHCQRCRLNFSAQTGAPTYREKKAHLNQEVFRFLCMGVSQRETARKLAVATDLDE